MATVGTISRGIKAPIVKKGDDLPVIVAESLLAAAADPVTGFKVQDRDVLAVTEAVVARAQGNYATVDQIAKDVRARTGGGTVGLIFPILSRNRFSMLLKGIAKGVDKLVIMLQLSFRRGRQPPHGYGRARRPRSQSVHGRFHRKTGVRNFRRSAPSFHGHGLYRAL